MLPSGCYCYRFLVYVHTDKCAKILHNLSSLIMALSRWFPTLKLNPHSLSWTGLIHYVYAAAPGYVNSIKPCRCGFYRVGVFWEVCSGIHLNEVVQHGE